MRLRSLAIVVAIVTTPLPAAAQTVDAPAVVPTNATLVTPAAPAAKAKTSGLRRIKRVGTSTQGASSFLPAAGGFLGLVASGAGVTALSSRSATVSPQ